MKICNLALILLNAPMIANAQEWAFDVYLDNNKIGKHTFELNNNNVLTSRALFNVKVLLLMLTNMTTPLKSNGKMAV